MTRMTYRSRQRWRQAATTAPFFHHDLGTAVLDAPATALRSAVGCRTNRDFERQLAAAETEGWLERSPEVCIDLERLDARMAQDQQLSDRAHRSARRDIDLLTGHGIAMEVVTTNNWVPVGPEGDVVDLAGLAQLLDVQSLGTAHWRLNRIRRLLSSEQPRTPHSEPASHPAAAPPPPAGAPTNNHAPNPSGLTLAERLVRLLEAETDTEVRRHLARAVASTLDSRTSVANDSRTVEIREPDATVRDNHARVCSESVPEQELPVPIREQTTRDGREASSRTDRGLTTSDQWSSPAELEPIIRPLETRTTALGPGARRTLMEWDPDQVRHAIDVLVGWIDNGFSIKNASAYITNAARSGYTSLFPLTSPTDQSCDAGKRDNQMWAERARTLPALACVDMIDNLHGPAPGRPYNRDAHLAALVAAAEANPAVAAHYQPEHPDAPRITELTPTSPGPHDPPPNTKATQ